MQAATDPDHSVEVVLQPLSRPDLGDIRICGVSVIGRTEQPFASFPHDVLAMLSRRHARVHCEDGAVYVADLGSRNGTTVNRRSVGQAPWRLDNGDEVCFGGALAYRVQMTPRAAPGLHEAFVLTLTPVSNGSGLQPIVIARFPLVVGKSDPAFARYHDDHARQVSFLSRRHAHIFKKETGAYIEDLDSTNGTFVDGIRLQGHPVRLEDGVLIAFGGEHFTYRVGIQDGSAIAAAAAAVAKPPDAQAARRPVDEPGVRDKTTFVAAPTSFLEIFCADDQPEQKAQADGSTATAVGRVESALQPAKRAARSRSAVLLSEVAALIFAHEGDRRRWWKVAAAAAVLAALTVGLSLWGHAERALKDAIERGDYAQAAALAHQRLLEHPDDADIRSVATETLLKANVPLWLKKLRSQDFDGARAALARMSDLGTSNPDVRSLIGELEWLGNLEQLVVTRGGPDAPFRIYADERRIAALIDRWNGNTGEHQRALARIESYVPEFSEPYAEALTHLRKLQSDATVYLAAIDRLKAAIAAELGRDEPQALDPVLKEAAEKYPGLGGLDNVRQDLAQYVEFRSELRNRRSARLFVLLLGAHFTTPPFQDAYRALSASQRLPSAQLLQQYAAATAAWKQGNTGDGVTGLLTIAAGPWADAINLEAQRRQRVMAQFAALQPLRASAGFAEPLLAFRASLDADQDVYFLRATQSDVQAQRDAALARANQSMHQARVTWQEYRGNGAIEARQRIETTVSTSFRRRARLLSDAARQAQQAMEIYRLVDVTAPASFVSSRDDIRAEVEQQRAALEELRNVLEPELLQTKLALLEGAT